MPTPLNPPDPEIAAAETLAAPLDEASLDDASPEALSEAIDASGEDQAPPASPSQPPQAALPHLNPAECAQALKARFPALFAGPPKPLKLRVQADIQARAPGVFTKQSLSGFLRRYTGSTGYLMALTRAPQRLDLDGQASEAVSEEHRLAAQEELARRRQLSENKRAEEMAEQADQLQRRRNRATLLRDFERTTLTESNFAALKGLAVDEMHGILERARSEAAEMPPERPEAPRRNAERAPAFDRVDAPARRSRPRPR
jgi:sRNA-binding protein